MATKKKATLPAVETPTNEAPQQVETTAISEASQSLETTTTKYLVVGVSTIDPVGAQAPGACFHKFHKIILEATPEQEITEASCLEALYAAHICGHMQILSISQLPATW